MGGRDPGTGAVTCCLPGSAVRNWAIMWHMDILTAGSNTCPLFLQRFVKPGGQVLWLSRLSYCLGCPYPMSDLGSRPSCAMLLNQLPANAPGRQKVMAQALGSLPLVEDQDGALGSRPRPGQALTAGGIWGLNQWMEISLSPFQISKYLKI